MMMNNQKIFINSIEAIKKQLDFDKEFVSKLNSIYGTENLPIYDNSVIIKNLVETTSYLFDKPKKAKEHIEHYIYDMNFGRFGSNDFITSEDLYSRIIELSNK